MLPSEITDSLAEYFSSKGPVPFQILASDPLSGGSINEVFRLETTCGLFCLKFNRAKAHPGMFEAEARGLRLLASARAVQVPEPVFAATLDNYSFLLLEFLVSGRAAMDMMSRLGTSLAHLHRHSAHSFGLDHSNYMGSLAQQNTWHDTWHGFFARERLDPQVRMARDAGLLEDIAVRHFESLYLELESIFPEEPPSLVHGDLWSGNYLVAGDGQAALIDPAAYYGHREVDIAMSTLFGGFSKGFYDSYDSEFPLAPGWQGRLDLCNLYPLLVHLNLFGTGYLGQILAIIRKF